MLDEAVGLLVSSPEGIYLDGTGSTGGHSEEILKRLSGGRLITLDLDRKALDIASNRLKNNSNLLLLHANFAETKRILPRLNINGLSGALLDLGLSSFCLDDPQRGFSHRLDGRLDMRFDPEGGMNSAAEMIEKLSEEDLTAIIRNFGEQSRGGKIARAIKVKKPQTTSELAEIVTRIVPHTQREKSLARVFQAFRISVNREMDNLKRFLEDAVNFLISGGRLVVISYHSLEDRMVKGFLSRESKDCICPPELPVCRCGHNASFKILTKHPITPSAAEIAMNPRARSARLRAGERL